MLLRRKRRKSIPVMMKISMNLRKMKTHFYLRSRKVRAKIEMKLTLLWNGTMWWKICQNLSGLSLMVATTKAKTAIRASPARRSSEFSNDILYSIMKIKHNYYRRVAIARS
mmetsp:Transcript_23881/g.38472  ORF Transcript_23881/g.38472 Transcript_23881/m.38472 type:complete len:111 (+) Transcript_23881:1166-1498(+)